jgi:hypothetical protein
VSIGLREEHDDLGFRARDGYVYEPITQRGQK